MKSTITLLSFGLLFLSVCLGFTLHEDEVATYKVDTEKSVIYWTGHKVTGHHIGSIHLRSGVLEFYGNKLTGGNFEIDMNTIECTDLPEKGATKLEGHLKSTDFFGVENHPVSKFVITKVVSRGQPGDVKIIGNLTIKEHTREIRFNARVEKKGSSGTATGEVKLDRSEFDIRFGSGSFFDDLGDKTIYDEFDLEVRLVF